MVGDDVYFLLAPLDICLFSFKKCSYSGPWSIFDYLEFA
jgi:hypothetical protein